MQKPKKPIPVAPWQAYSRLYFKKSLPLHQELHTNFKNFKAGQQDTVAKYSHLFPSLESTSSILWLPFYQAVMKDLVDNASEVELTAVSNYIDARYQKALDKHK